MTKQPNIFNYSTSELTQEVLLLRLISSELRVKM